MTYKKQSESDTKRKKGERRKGREGGRKGGGKGGSEEGRKDNVYSIYFFQLGSQHNELIYNLCCENIFNCSDHSLLNS